MSSGERGGRSASTRSDLDTTNMPSTKNDEAKILILGEERKVKEGLWVVECGCKGRMRALK